MGLVAEHRVLEPRARIGQQSPSHPREVPDFDRDEVAEILRLLPKTRHQKRLIPIIGWFYASVFRPEILRVEKE